MSMISSSPGTMISNRAIRPPPRSTADGKLFITTGHSLIRAFEAATGKLLWEYDGGTRDRAKIPLHFGWGNSGVAYSDGKLVLATTDGYVIALDANSGREVWKTYDYPDQSPRNMPGAPRIFGGKVIIGHGGADITPLRGLCLRL